MGDIFILHEAKDEQRAEQLSVALSASGWSVSRKRVIPRVPSTFRLDAKSPPWGRLDQPAEDARRWLEEQARLQADKDMAAARCVLALWSRHSFASPSFKETALKWRGPGFVQAVLDSIDEPPRQFCDSAWISLSDWNGTPDAEPFLVLKQAIAQALNGPATQRGSSAASAGAVSDGISIDRHRSAVGGGSPQPGARPSHPGARAIFLCYRRDDAQGDAGRIRDGLSAVFGPGSVFMDVDDVPFGVDFVDHINSQLDTCTAVIVVIGRSWASSSDKRGRRRLDLPHDYVRGEIAQALSRKITVIPVLVQNAAMPDSEELPEDIRPLGRLNAIDLSHRRWRYDMEQLCEVLRGITAGPPPPSTGV